jgi:hypothetical protein
MVNQRAKEDILSELKIDKAGGMLRSSSATVLFQPMKSSGGHCDLKLLVRTPNIFESTMK